MDRHGPLVHGAEEQTANRVGWVLGGRLLGQLVCRVTPKPNVFDPNQVKKIMLT